MDNTMTETTTRQTPRTDEVTPWEGNACDGPMCCYCGFARCDADGACECVEEKVMDSRAVRMLGTIVQGEDSY